MGSVELKRWRDALIADREDLLIEAARRWLGPVKTPFNKHQLLERVESYLRRPDTVQATIDLMDGYDRLAVAALSVMGDLPPEVLDAVMSASLSDSRAGNAKRRLANLRERMVVYVYRNARGRERVGLVPPLAEALGGAFGMSDLVRGATREAAPRGTDPWSVFCAVFSACARVKPAFKSHFEFTKKAASLLSGSAPELLDGSLDAGFFLGCLAGARALVPGEAGRMVPDPERFAALAEAFGESAPLAMACAHPDYADTYVRPELRAAFLRYLVAVYPRGVAMDPQDADRFARVAASSFFAARVKAGDRELEALLEADDGRIMDDIAASRQLEDLGLLAQCGAGRLVLTQAADGILSRPGPGPALVMEESHEIKVMPEADAATRAYIAAIARLEKTGLVWTAVLDKDAALSAFSYGFSADTIAARLELLSGKPLPQSVRFSLDTWQAQSRGAMVFSGIVAKLDEHNSAVLTHSPKAQGAVREKLADGVFLLNALSMKDAEKLLKAAGIRVEIKESADATILQDMPDAWSDASIAALGAGFVGEAPAVPAFRMAADAAADSGEAPASATLERLMGALDRLELAPGARAILTDKIRSRLILDESQLGGIDLSADVGAAGALDYPGKVRILERALRDGDPVEMAFSAPDGRRKTSMGIPVELRKTATGLIAMTRLRSGDVEPVAVSAIEKLRLIHTDLFGE